MHLFLTVGCFLLLWQVATPRAAELSPTDRKAKSGDPPVNTILREASKLALKQEGFEHLWTDEVLLQIAEMQIRERDFDGALLSIGGSSNPRDRN
jgi:hypothetical protein